MMVSEPQPIPPEIVPTRLSEDAYIALRKLEYDHSLARLGLQGTLWGSVASLVTIIIIVVLVPLFSAAPVVRGWEVVGVVAAIVVPIVFYGSFIFARALSISAQIDKEGSSLRAATGDEPRAPSPSRGLP